MYEHALLCWIASDCARSCFSLCAHVAFAPTYLTCAREEDCECLPVRVRVRVRARARDQLARECRVESEGRRRPRRHRRRLHAAGA
eukprot:876672-Pleurochrysis_carterae.AAC.2